MSSDLRKVSGKTPYNVEFNSTGTHPSEGAYVFQYKKYYYLFFSSGICCGYDQKRPAPGEEYKIMVCRADKVSGPYVSRHSRLLAQRYVFELKWLTKATSNVG